MIAEKYIPTEFTCTNYEYTTRQDVTHYHSELSFIANNNKMKYHKDSKKDSNYYKSTDSTVYQNVPSSNFKINSNHYVHLDYFSVIDGVMIEDERGFLFKISNANFIQLARECTIKNGIIEDACVLGFDKHARVTLVKVGSSFYEEVMSYTTKQNYDFKEEDLVVGKTYRFKKDQNSVYVYLGKHKFKSKRDSYMFEASIIQPKVPQHIFSLVRIDGTISSRFTSAKIYSIQEEVNIELKTDLENVLSSFKNSWQGRVISEVQIIELTIQEQEKIMKSGQYTYIVVKLKDGSLHLGRNDGRSGYYTNDYICPLDPKTYMPVAPMYLKESGYPTRDEHTYINTSGLEWFKAYFKFEDPLSSNF